MDWDQRADKWLDGFPFFSSSINFRESRTELAPLFAKWIGEQGVDANVSNLENTTTTALEPLQRAESGFCLLRFFFGSVRIPSIFELL